MEAIKELKNYRSIIQTKKHFIYIILVIVSAVKIKSVFYVELTKIQAGIKKTNSVFIGNRNPILRIKINIYCIYKAPGHYSLSTISFPRIYTVLQNRMALNAKSL